MANDSGKSGEFATIVQPAAIIAVASFALFHYMTNTHDWLSAVGSVLGLYKDFLLLKFPHGVACIVGKTF